jgi:Cu-processing system permease protein
MSAALVIGRRTCADALRGRAGLLQVLVFAALTLLISYAGLVSGGILGFQALSRTALSLVSLLLYLVPLVAVVQGAGALSKRGGWLELLMAQPVSRRQIVIGEFLGLWLAAGGSIACGVAAGSAGVWLRAGGDPGALGMLLALALGLAMVFTAVGLALGAVFAQRGTALAAALGVWFACVVLYDLCIVGLTALLEGGSLERILVLAAAANPVDAARILALGAFVGRTLFGATGAAVTALLGPAGRLILSGVMVAWVAISLVVAVRLFERREG